ncbi:MAG: glucosamine 6-phosphate synthetase [Sedimentisphaeraceae bacterium JB056]
MCGQAGVIFGKKRRRKADRQALGELFTQMLLGCQRRGPHATGLALVRNCGSYRLFKRPCLAEEFVTEPNYENILEAIDNNVTALLGHTRWRTRGSEKDSRNNHPLRCGVILGTHNGTIYNANELFAVLGLPRFAQVDSEIIFRLADRFTPQAEINLEGFSKALRLCRGQMSAVLVSLLDPERIIVIKGNKPLSLFYSQRHKVICYASEAGYITDVIDKQDNWQELETKPNTILEFNFKDLENYKSRPFKFIAQQRKPLTRNSAI